MKRFLRNQLTCWLPEDSEIEGNTYFNAPNSRQAINNIQCKAILNYLVEPNYGSTGVCMYVRSLEQVKMLDPFSTVIPRADGICMDKEFMKKNRIGIFMRPSDCIALGIITDKDVRILHISVESLNNGILMNLPTSFKYAEAVLGPCICKGHLLYDLADNRVGNKRALAMEPSSYEKFIERTKYYKVFGYDQFIIYNEEHKKAYIDIKGIVKYELKRANIDIVFDDTRCTVCDSLGSHRLHNSKVNAMVIF